MIATTRYRPWSGLKIPGNPTVSLVIAAYQQADELLCLLYSLRAQTYANWEAVVVHDGPSAETERRLNLLGDTRIRLIQAPEHRGDFGHHWRQLGVEACTGDFIGLTNGDNYYVPVYFEWMLYELVRTNADLAYCDMVHSHWHWSFFLTSPHRCCIDLGAWIARSELVKATPWKDMSFDGDATFLEGVLAKAKKCVHVPKCLFVHN